LLAAALLRLAPLHPPAYRQADAHVMRLYPGTAVVVTEARTLNLRERARPDLLYSIRYLKRHNSDFTASIMPALKNGTVYVAAYDADDDRVKILIDDARVLDLSDTHWQPISATPLREQDVMHVTERD
jgi:hypothetical protein